MNKKHTQLSRRIYHQFRLSILGILALITGLYFLFRFLCSQVTWYEGDPLYDFLKSLDRSAPFLAGLILFVSIFFLTRFFMRIPLKYMDQAIEAAKMLSNPNEEPISLPPEISDVETELNLARETALRNAYHAKEAEQRKNDLIVYLAHDLKTPLTSIIGYLSLLSDEPDLPKETQQKYLDIALNKSYRLEDLINEFFDITRFNLSNISLEYSKVSFSLMLSQICYEFGPLLLEKSLSISTDIEENVTLECDPEKLERVIDNLIRNAIHYSYENTTINLSMKKAAETVIIQIKNHGNTIPPEKCSRLFEQFFRLDHARQTHTGGSGLGLAISKKLVELHKGTITAESQNEEILFTVTLPISHISAIDNTV